MDVLLSSHCVVGMVSFLTASCRLLESVFYDKDLPTSQELQSVTLASETPDREHLELGDTGSVHWYRVLLLEAQGHVMSARQWHSKVSRVQFICVISPL